MVKNADQEINFKMNDDLIYILNRFPTYKSRILSEYLINEEFKTLVEDFYSTGKTLESFRNKMTIQAKNELEYKELFDDLENEIKRFLGSKSGWS